MSTKIEKENIVIRLCGDSGDGMQLIGKELANTSAIFGNDIGTLPDFPAEIRAPKGTVAGVSGYQLNIGSYDIHTPGDLVDCLIAMNPAALKANIKYLKDNGAVIVDSHSFSEKNLKLAGYDENPLSDSSLDSYQLFAVDITQNTRLALEHSELSSKNKDRCKNFYALGMVSWMFQRPLEHAIKTLNTKFKTKEDILDANITTLKAGYNYCDITEMFLAPTLVKPASLEAGNYRSITGNSATVLGVLAAAEISGIKIFYGGYPITPASDILHDFFAYEHLDVKIFQAEDEIAAIGAAIGASYAGDLGVTASSGPGIALKTEAIGLAAMTELPLLIINVQRSGPSTGMPTKTEQADLFQAVFGRNGETPIPVISASRPADCFDTVYEACRIAIKYMTPVMFLSDGYIANGSEPWKIPEMDNLREVKINERDQSEEFLPYKRDAESLARAWTIPGEKGLEHRIGGLEKSEDFGDVSYDPENHFKMSKIRQEKIERAGNDFSPLYVDGDITGDILLLGWGSTYGTIRTTVEKLRKENISVCHIHLRWLNPLHPDLEKYMTGFKKVIIPEINLGQLITIIRAKYLINAIGFNIMKGLPLIVSELYDFIKGELDD